MAHLNNSQFTTKDSDNDQIEGTNRAHVALFGGWWHTAGYYVQLTGIGRRNFWYNSKGSKEAYLSSPDYSHYHNKWKSIQKVVIMNANKMFTMLVM